MAQYASWLPCIDIQTQLLCTVLYAAGIIDGWHRVAQPHFEYVSDREGEQLVARSRPARHAQRYATAHEFATMIYCVFNH